MSLGFSTRNLNVPSMQQASFFMHEDKKVMKGLAATFRLYSF